jgi:hypothetical protein
VRSTVEVLANCCQLVFITQSKIHIRLLKYFWHTNYCSKYFRSTHNMPISCEYQNQKHSIIYNLPIKFIKMWRVSCVFWTAACTYRIVVLTYTHTSTSIGLLVHNKEHCINGRHSCTLMDMGVEMPTNQCENQLVSLRWVVSAHHRIFKMSGRGHTVQFWKCHTQKRKLLLSNNSFFNMWSTK